MSTRREFMKALAAIGAVAAVPAGAFDALMPAAPVISANAVIASPGMMTLRESMQRAYEQCCEMTNEPDFIYLSKDLYERLVAAGAMKPRSEGLSMASMGFVVSEHMAPNTYAEIPRALLR